MSATTEDRALFSVGDIALYAHLDESAKDANARREFVRIEALIEKESTIFHSVRTVWGGAEKETTAERLIRIELPKVSGISLIGTGDAPAGSDADPSHSHKEDKKKGAQQGSDIEVGDYAIGIDVGTSYFSAAAWRDDHIEIIPNEYEDRITPAVVAFSDEERLIGSSAKDFASTNATNTIFDIKRLIGRYFDDPEVQSEICRWPFKVIRGVDDKPLIQVTYKGVQQTFHPEEVYAMQLAKVKESAEAYLGGRVTQAVLTVPANFCEAQRQATRDAAVIAGFQVLRLVSEPTAAAIAYGLERKGGEQTILVVDIGGGAADVSLLTIEDGIFEVKATAGDTCFGGVDFDERLVEHCLAEYKGLHGHEVGPDLRAVQRLRIACEHAKRALSEHDHANIELEEFHRGQDFATIITRAKFEELNADYFQRILEPIQKVLKDTKTLKEEVDDIVLAGGSTRIPKIQHLLEEFFHGKELNTSVNPDEAAAYGAAIQAAILSGRFEKCQQLEDILLLDVVPHSIAIETSEGDCETIIREHSTIPAKKGLTLTNAEDNQTGLVIKFLEIVDGGAKRRLLGEIKYDGITPRRAGTSLIEANFDLDADDHLRVAIAEIPYAEEDVKTFSVTSSMHFSPEEIREMIVRAQRMTGEEVEAHARDAAKCRLEKYATRMEEYLVSQGALLPPNSKQILETKTLQVQQWLRDNISVDQFAYDGELRVFEGVVEQEMKREQSVFQFAPPSPLKKKNKGN